MRTKIPAKNPRTDTSTSFDKLLAQILLKKSAPKRIVLKSVPNSRKSSFTQMMDEPEFAAIQENPSREEVVRANRIRKLMRGY